MISIDEAIQIIKENIRPPFVCESPIEDAIGRYLAEDVHAPEPSPRYTNSAMDGYAVRWEDVADATKTSPVKLKIAGESRAGF
jgi:molybdopterin molybdotransferase